MRIPFAWIAAGAVVGSWAWPMWTPDPVGPILGTLITALLVLFSSKRLLTICLVVSGFLLGTTAVGQQLGPWETQAHLFGTVLAKSGKTVRVRTTSGTVFVHMSNPLPPVGSTITAWVKQRKSRPILPGAWNPENTSLRFRAPLLTAIQWELIGEHQQPPTISQHHPYGGVLLALSVGDRSHIDDTLKRLMRRTGTIHLLSISGLHVGMLAGMGALFFWLLSRPLVLIGWPHVARFLVFTGSTGTACFYGQLVGWPVSTQRAAWMVTAVGLAALLERRPDPWQILGLAALLVVLNEPAQAGTLSFLLSFGAIAGLIGWVPVLTTWIPEKTPRLLRWLTSSISATTAATIGTLPVSLWVFQEISLSSPLANLVAVPLFSGLVVPAALLGIQLPSEWGETFLALAATGIDLCLQWLRLCDWGTISPAISFFGALALGVAVFLHKKIRWALLLSIISFVRPPSLNNDLEVFFPDIGQGSSALITWPDGTHWLIDGGPTSRSLLHWLRRKGIRKIDSVFLTHPDKDHLSGLIPIVESLDVDHLWSPRRPRPSEKTFRDFWIHAAQKGVQLHLASEGHPNILYPNTHWDPSDTQEDNDMSLVLYIENGQHRFLFTGDISRKIENQLIGRLGPMTVVQVPHHGSDSSSSAEFVDKTQPLFAVIQSGKDNRFGHPHPITTHRWGPEKVLRTDIFGSIRVRSDGNLLDVCHWTPKTGWVSVTKQFADRR